MRDNYTISINIEVLPIQGHSPYRHSSEDEQEIGNMVSKIQDDFADYAHNHMEQLLADISGKYLKDPQIGKAYEAEVTT